MATTNPRRQPAALTIPAVYLEDVRTALVGGINGDADWVRTMQQDLLKGTDAVARDGARDDRAGAMRVLLKDVQLLEKMLGETTDTEYHAEGDTLSHALQAMARVLSGRLADEMEYAPVDMAAVLELAKRLQWAAEEALRIEPALDPTRHSDDSEAVA